MTTKITSEKQLDEWVKGNPIHGDECCPDFSCCRGIETIAPKYERERFAQAVKEGDEKTQHQMLGGFLGRAIAEYKPKVKIHIAGDEAERNEIQ